MGILKRILVILFITSSMSYLMCEEIPLQFEKLFPDSPYSDVYNQCTEIWNVVRQTRNNAQEQLNEFNEQVIDDLMTLHALIKKMLSEPHSCSPDDIEYLLGILQIIQNKHARICEQHVDEQAICTTVLFDHLKKKLSKPLVDEES